MRFDCVAAKTTGYDSSGCKGISSPSRKTSRFACQKDSQNCTISKCSGGRVFKSTEIWGTANKILTNCKAALSTGSSLFHISISEWAAVLPQSNRISSVHTRFVIESLGQSDARNILPYLRMSGPIYV